MRLSLVFLLCVALQAVASEITLADATTSASVERTQAPVGFKISVVFRPVTTLDETSNQEMSEVLAQFYADEALSAFLNVQKSIVIEKTRTNSEKVDGGMVRWKFVVPESAVVDAPMTKVEIREFVIGKKNKDRKRTDTQTQILDFRSSCFRDLRVAETLFADEVRTKKDLSGMDALQQRVQDAVSALRKRIKEDDDLFRSEKIELLNKVDKVEDHLVRLIKGNDSNPESETKLPIKEAVFKEPFGNLLKSDQILLTHGGARFIEIKGGDVAIVAVGFASADNDDREDIAELKASAELGKLRAGEESVVANKFERHYSRASNGAEVKEEVDTKRISAVSVNSLDFHKSGETVGTWLSLDGRRFFLAKGRIVHRKPTRKSQCQD